MRKQVHHQACPKCREQGRDTRGDNCAVYSDGGMYCFSCGWNKSPTRYVPAVKEEDVQQTMLPSDFTRDIPATAWKWLLQYGLGYRYWLPYLGWSQKYSRLVFTVGEPTEFAIGRYIEVPGDEREGPPRKWFGYGLMHRTPHIFGDIEKADKIVLVEDLISAHKVGQVQPCIPLFGTAVFDSVVPCLKHLGLPVVMWYDQDQQGAMVARASRLSCYINQPVTYVFSENDPKANSLAEIERKLKKSFGST